MALVTPALKVITFSAVVTFVKRLYTKYNIEPHHPRRYIANDNLVRTRDISRHITTRV